MESRRFGASQIPLSSLTFGSMRLDPERTPKREAVALFELLQDRGVTTFHSSYEYDSFDYFCECLQSFRQLRPQAQLRHIVKLPAPHFDEFRFSEKSFVDRIERYLSALGAERLDVVQWIVRQKPNTYENRSAVLEECIHELAAVWDRLRRQGKVGAMASFPYDPTFAAEALEHPICEGLVTYLNLVELDYAPLINRTSFIAIRPLYAGLLTPEGLASPSSDNPSEQQTVRNALEELGVSRLDAGAFAARFCLMHENVTSVIAGCSTVEHARELADAVETARPDRAEFDRIVGMLSQAKPVA